jgi:outer membrane protein assembly complex protein YaeT
MSSLICRESTNGRRATAAAGRSPGAALAALALLAVLTAPAARPAAAADELDFGLEQHTLHRIVFAGNRVLSSAELKSILKISEPSLLHPLRMARYQPELLDAELRVIQRYYRQRGFHAASAGLDSIARDPRGRGDVVYIGVREGPRTYLERLVFDGVGPLEENRLREGLRFVEERPIPADLNDLGPDLYLLRSRYWDLGYLRARIEPQLVTTATADATRRAAVLTYRIEPGPAYVVGKMSIAGNRLTRSDLIARGVTLREGRPYRWDLAEASQRRLLDTALFRDVNLVPAVPDSGGNVVDFSVSVVERKPAFYEFGVGVGSRERLRVLAAWGHNNLWGTGQRLQLRVRPYLSYERILNNPDTRVTPQFNYRFDLLHVYPYLFSDRLRLNTNLYLERKTRGESGLNLETRGLTFGTQFRAGRRIIHGLSLKAEEVRPLLHPDAPDSLGEVFTSLNIRPTRTRAVIYNLAHERRNDIFRPISGALVTAEGAVAVDWLGGSNSFVKGSAAWHGYTGTPIGGSLALRVTAGAVRPYGQSADLGNEGVPYQERFFAGGGASVRGYQEGSLGPQLTNRDFLELQNDVPVPDGASAGGNYLLLANAEWRFPLPVLSRWKLGGVLFIDGGNVWQRLDDLRLRAFRLRAYPRLPEDPSATKLWDFRYSVGTGLRLDTPFGPFRVDVGFPLKRARLSETLAEDRALFHFSLGYPF